MGDVGDDGLADYQKQFIDFLVECDVLTFGDFTTKSGRKTPYFVNTGRFNSGSKIERLGKFYANHIHSLGLGRIDTVFGPAYKGIPLSVATASSMFKEFGQDCGFTFDRKEEKKHGDGGNLVGRKLQDDDRIVIVEDVITAGTTLREIVPAVREMAKIDILGVVISVDRCERGTTEVSAVEQAKRDLDIEIFPIVNIYQIVSYLCAENPSGFSLSRELQSSIASYLEEYGPKA